MFLETLRKKKGVLHMVRHSIRTRYSLATAFFLLLILGLFYVGGRIVLVHLVKDAETKVRAIGSDINRMALRVIGRTVKEKPVEALMKALEGPAFTNALVIAKKVPAAQASPRIRSFHQESTASGEGERLLAFDIEYRCVERRFEK